MNQSKHDILLKDLGLLRVWVNKFSGDNPLALFRTSAIKDITDLRKKEVEWYLGLVRV